MVRDPRTWAAAVACGLAAWLIVPCLFPERPPRVAAGSVPEIRYVCRESGEVFVLPASAGGVSNPKTGRETLVPAVFDKRSGKWRPGPPPGVMHARGLLKPVRSNP